MSIPIHPNYSHNNTFDHVSADKKTKTLFLVDGSGFIFRAFHALPPLTRPDGVMINAVYGFTRMILKLKRDLNAQYMGVIFDAARDNFRYKIYDKYKANRGETPPDLIPQFPLIREATKALNLNVYEKEGYEADDVIATFTKQALNEGLEVIIVSSDKDLYQLIQPRVKCFDPIKNKFITEEDSIAKFGVPPAQVIDVLSLWGDTSDNIPGVPGIGTKIAAQLIQEYGSLEGIYQNIETLPASKRKDNLIAFQSQAYLSKLLVRLCETVPIGFSLDEFSLYPPHKDALKAFFLAQNFNALLNQIDDICETAEETNHTPSYELITTEAQLASWCTKIKHHGRFALHCTTTSLNVNEAQLVGIALSIGKNQACYIPLRHNKNNNLLDGHNQHTEQLPLSTVIEQLKPLCESPNILKIGHHLKYECHILAQHELYLSPIDDTLLISFVTSSEANSYRLHDLTQHYFNHQITAYENLIGKGKNKINFADVTLDKACDYAAETADYTYQLYEYLFPHLTAKGVNFIYETCERPLIPVLLAMEQKGIKIDVALLKSLSQTFAKNMQTIESQIYTMAGCEFNLASPKQLGEVLFETLKLPLGKKSKTGQYSTHSDILQKLSQQGYEIADHILEWRGCAKLKSTYTDTLVAEINPKTNRVHTHYSMIGATTGRLASQNPNLQNIPVRTKEGREIRKAFIAKPGYCILSLDYSQIELRLLAHMANLPELIEAFLNKQDIHQTTAAKIFGCALEAVTPELRRSAKAINFGIIYGMSAYGLSEQLGINVDAAKHFIKTYFSQFPGIEAFINKCKETAHAQGYVTTLFGRKIYTPHIRSENVNLRHFAERQSINFPLQGSAADLMKRAMIRIHKALQQETNAHMLLTVHDEVLLEVEESHVESIINLIRPIMETAHLPHLTLNLPLVVDAGSGKNWEEAH